MELSAEAMVVAWLIIFGGAVVRGFTGFGASLLWISGLTFLMDADEAVPIIFCLEVLVSAQLAPSVRNEIEWRVVRRLLTGVVLGMPVGAVVLLVLESDPMRLVVSGIVLVSAVALGAGLSFPVSERAGPQVGVGALSGLLNGAAATGGPPVVVFFLGSERGIAVGRASMIAFFGFTDVLGIALTAASGLLDATAVLRVTVFVPAMVVGAMVGARRFGAVSSETVRRAALVVLAGLSFVGIATTLVG